MTSGTRSVSLLSRRTVLGSAIASVGLSAVPERLRAGFSTASIVVAIAFDGDSLLVAALDLSRSDDGGQTWEKLPAPEGGAILSLATHTDRPRRIFAGLASGGVALSEDGGRTWRAGGSGLPSGAVRALAVAAVLPNTIYAAVNGDGLWKSENAGQSWAFVMDRPWLVEAERDLLALASVKLATGMGGIWIYAGTGTGLTRVPDCFCRWQEVQAGDAMDALASGTALPPEAPLPAGEAIRALVSAPSAPEIMYAALPSGVWSSRNAGVVWSQLLPGNATALAVHPVRSSQVIASIDDSLNKSRDSGTNWSALAVI